MCIRDRHPAVRDRAAGRPCRRDDPDRQSGITGAPGGAPSTKEKFRPTGSGKSAGFPGPIFYFSPRIKISRIFVQVCPVILSQIFGLFCARSTKLPTPPPENSAFCLDILHGTALYLCRKETPGMKMHGYVFFCPEVPVFFRFSASFPVTFTSL